jgi:hypothetical protein
MSNKSVVEIRRERANQGFQTDLNGYAIRTSCKRRIGPVETLSYPARAKNHSASKIQRPGACDANLLLIENSGIGQTRIS